MLGRTAYSEINANLSRQLEEKKCLIAVHRGSWGGDIIQNTCPAYDIALKMGGDMFEIDLVRSTDGVLYCFHAGNEPRVLGVQQNIKTMSSQEIDAFEPINSIGGRSIQKIERLENVLRRYTHGELYNIDRAWDILPEVLAMLDRYPHAVNQALIKAPVRSSALDALAAHAVKYMFMPICYQESDIECVWAREDINMVGAELIAETPADPLFSDDIIASLHAHGLFAWVNAITLGTVRSHALFGGLDDNISVKEGFDKGWGGLLRKRIDIIQTDWPSLLCAYRAAFFSEGRA